MPVREPGQVRKEAALSDSRHVMRTSLARAKHGESVRELRFDGGCTVHIPFTWSMATRGETRDTPARPSTPGIGAETPPGLSPFPPIADYGFISDCNTAA